MDKKISETLLQMAQGLEEATANGTLPTSTEEILGAVTNTLEQNIDDIENNVNNEQNEEDEQTILEEYKLWRKNCRYMYSFVSETALTWPSLSIQFIKSNTFENKMKDTKFATTRNLLLTTHTSGDDDDYLKIASLQLPKSLTEGKILSSEELETVNSRLKISKKFKQDIEINKVRVNPFNNRIWATINANGQVFVYEADSKMNIILEKELIHHNQNGFGLSWDPFNESRLVTSSEDKTVALWDYKLSDKPINIYNDHTNFVNDVRFSFKKKDVIGSIGEDKKFILRDVNKNEILIDKEMQINKTTAFNSFTFSPFNENLVIFGGEDSNIYLYDLRKIEHCLHTLIGHTKPITNIEWDPFHDNIVGSSSMDRRVILWDLTKIGEEQLPEEAEDGVPELVMMHGGHTGGVNDFAFSMETEWCIASCSDDNIVHVWAVKFDVMRPKVETVENSVLE
jgi:histone-binding protein RBBP4